MPDDKVEDSKLEVGNRQVNKGVDIQATKKTPKNREHDNRVLWDIRLAIVAERRQVKLEPSTTCWDSSTHP